MIGRHAVHIPDEDLAAVLHHSVRADSKTPLALLQAAATYHQYPHIGPVQVFPRLDGTASTPRISKMANLQSIESNFMENVVTDWSECYRRLFALWKLGKCHLFYLCATSFTVLFLRTEREALSTSLPTITEPTNCDCTIVVTPTASGFRETLRTQGVSFSMPLRLNVNFLGLDEEDECAQDFIPSSLQGKINDLDHDEWLKEIGISPKSTLRLRRSASAFDFSADNCSSLGTSDIRLDESTNSIQECANQDSTSSTILIEDEESIDAFYEFLLKSRSSFTKNGPQAGLPPTLLAPYSFYKSVAMDLTMSSHITRKNGELKYVLELEDGPVLPSVSNRIVEFMRSLSCTDANKVQIQIGGRATYTGLNEAFRNSLIANCAEFEVELPSGGFSW